MYHPSLNHFTWQDILKALIKNDYDTSYTKDIYMAELDEDEEEEVIEQAISKSFY